MKIEISHGELVDKLIILSIKLEQIKDQDKLKNIQKEYNILNDSVRLITGCKESELYKELYNVNKKLWEIEDKIREKEAAQDFDLEFIELARSVYFTNDQRSNIKKQINLKYGSNIVEEKSYREY